MEGISQTVTSKDLLTGPKSLKLKARITHFPRQIRGECL